MFKTHVVQTIPPLAFLPDNSRFLQKRQMPRYHRQINITALADLAHTARASTLGQAHQEPQPRHI
jgi:hypothetical protein